MLRTDPPTSRRPRRLGLALAALLGLAGCGTPDSTSVEAGGGGTSPAAGTAVPARTGTPDLRVGVVAERPVATCGTSASCRTGRCW